MPKSVDEVIFSSEIKWNYIQISLRHKNFFPKGKTFKLGFKGRTFEVSVNKAMRILDKRLLEELEPHVGYVLTFTKKSSNEFLLEKSAMPVVKEIKIGADFMPCNYANDILRQTAEWIIRHGGLKPNELPVELGRKRFLVLNHEKMRKSGRKFKAQKKLSNGLWIDLRLSTESSIRYARELLEHFRFKEKLEVYGF